MSSTLLKQSLEIVDPDLVKRTDIKNRSKIKRVFDLIPDSQKITSQVYKKGRKGEKFNLLSTTSKLNIVDVKKNIKSQDEILKDNLKKLELIRKACTIKLDQSATHKIIERGVTKRPLKPKRRPNKKKKTAFTEEDFAKFEAEYINE